MTRGRWNHEEDTLPRAREKAPEGLCTKFLWRGKREHSKSDTLLRMLMPKEYEKVEILRKMKRERILREQAARDGISPTATHAAVESAPAIVEEVAEAGAEEEAIPDESSRDSDGNEDGASPEEDDVAGNEEEHCPPEPEPEASASAAASDPAPGPGPDVEPARATREPPKPPSKSSHPPTPTPDNIPSTTPPPQSSLPTEPAAQPQQPLLPFSQDTVNSLPSWYPTQQQTWQWPQPEPIAVHHAKVPDPIIPMRPLYQHQSAPYRCQSQCCYYYYAQHNPYPKQTIPSPRSWYTAYDYGCPPHSHQQNACSAPPAYDYSQPYLR